MDDLIVWVSGWDAEGNERLAERLRTWGGVPHVATHCDFTRHEPQNYNVCIRESIAQGYRFALFADSDVEFLCRETIPALYRFINSADCSQIGSVRPWRSGEPAQSEQYPPEEKYVDDNTAMMFRLDTGAWFDEELLFTGWSDLDFGNELEYRGWKNYNDRRFPVQHCLERSRAHGRSTALVALKKRNKLIVDYKWHLCGRANWHGVTAFNATLPLERQIPSMQQIVALPNDDQMIFAESISPEHHQIWVKDHHLNPNLEWLNPLVVGYSTRERFYLQHGYA